MKNNILEKEKLNIKDINNYTNDKVKSLLNVKEESKLLNNEENSLKSIEKEEPKENNIDSINIKPTMFKDKIDLYNSENDNIKLISIRKLTNNYENNEGIMFKEKISIDAKSSKQNSIEQTNEVKNNFNEKNSNNINSLKFTNEKNIPHAELYTISNTIETKKNNDKLKENKNLNRNIKPIQNNILYPRTSLNGIGNRINVKNNTYRSPNFPQDNYLIENSAINKLLKNKNFNYNYKQNDNIKTIYNKSPSVNISNSTSFPKIKKDLSEQKYSMVQKSNYLEQKEMSLVSKTLSEAKFSNQETKVASQIKKQKKLLLINPDEVPSSSMMRKKVKKNVIYKSLENPSEKSNKSKKFENVKNHEFQSFPIK